jgi:hypothetical protein
MERPRSGRARSTAGGVRAVAARDDVGPVVDGPVIEDVGATEPGERVGAEVAIERVVLGTSGEHVVAGAADDALDVGPHVIAFARRPVVGRSSRLTDTGISRLT